MRTVLILINIWDEEARECRQAPSESRCYDTRYFLGYSEHTHTIWRQVSRYSVLNRVEVVLFPCLNSSLWELGIALNLAADCVLIDRLHHDFHVGLGIFWINRSTRNLRVTNPCRCRCRMLGLLLNQGIYVLASKIRYVDWPLHHLSSEPRNLNCDEPRAGS